MRPTKQIWKMRKHDERNVLHRKSLWESCVKKEKEILCDSQVKILPIIKVIS